MALTILAVTGGVACGKSHACRKMVEAFSSRGKEVIRLSSDDIVGELLEKSEVLEKLSHESSQEIRQEDGSLNRSLFRDLVFENSEIRDRIEKVLHPLVLESINSSLEDRRDDDKTKSSFAIIEVPLLYEVEFPLNREIDLVIGCSKQTQIKRLQELRQISTDLAGKILAAQLPVPEKIKRGNYVLWNDGTLESFEDQIIRLTNFLISNQSDNDRRG